MLRSKKRTQGRKYHRGKRWVERRDAAFLRAGTKCEVSGEPIWISINPDKAIWKRAAHHIFSERFCRRFIPGSDPHLMENLVVIHPSVHAKCTAIERKVYSGDFVGFCTELRRIGFNQWMIDRALKALYASAEANKNARTGD